MTARYTYWKQSDSRYLGHLVAFPDRWPWTQGEDFNDLTVKLNGIHRTFTAAELPGTEREAEREIAS